MPPKVSDNLAKTITNTKAGTSSVADGEKSGNLIVKVFSWFSALLLLKERKGLG